MVLKKLNKIFFLVILLSPTLSYAGSDEISETQKRGRFSILDEGERAPFPGVIYDALGNAVILSTHDRMKEEKELELAELSEIMQANFEKEYALLESQRKADKQKYEGIIKAKDQEIKELRKEASGRELPGWAWLGIGAGGGALATALAIALVAL